MISKKIKDFKSQGISILEKSTEKELSKMVSIAKEYYENGHCLFTDNEYDILLEYIERKFPHNKVSKEVGAPVTKNKVTLPFEMASMNKIKPDTNALSQWLNKYKGPYIVSCKLDGVSGLYTNENGTHRLYTRGDGLVGQDISYLLDIIGLPILHTGYAVRGEFIIPKNVFENKYKDTFANARNLVSGIINSKSMDDKTADLRFITYELISPILRPSEQLLRLERMGFLYSNTVLYQSHNIITNESLSRILLEWRSDYDFEIDGVVVTDDHIYNRASGNPEHAFAFKMLISDQMAEAKVVDVIWTPSKDGYLKPRVRLEPVRLNGVTIEYATGFNGKFIEENRIGIGAVIQLVRSGDVIPFIKSVTVPAENPKMPDVPYIWTESHVDVILENLEDDKTVREKMVTLFFVSLGVEGLSSGNVHRLFETGFDSVSKILKMSKEDFEKVEGFKSRMAEKIGTSIREKIEKASLIDIMVASNKLGRGLGERKIKMIMDSMPDILLKPETNEQKIERLQQIKGIGTENANDFVEHIPEFLNFLKECGLETKLVIENRIVENRVVENQENKNHPLYGKKIVMTKVRDKNIIEFLKKVGATLEEHINKETFVLIVKSKEETTNKTEIAKKHGIMIMEPEEFNEKYMG